MSDKKKVPGKPFVKGTSGNPGGSPASIREVRELAQRMSPDVMQRLYEINQDREGNPMASVAAGREILDRAQGKAVQTQVTLGLDDGIGDGDTSGLSALLLRAKFEQSKRKLIPPNGNGNGNGG